MGAVNPAPDAAQQIQLTATFFDRWAEEGRGEAMAQGHWASVSQILAQMGLEPGMAALDVGCGNGYAVRAMAEAVGPAGRVDGVDASGQMTARAQQQTSVKHVLFQQSTAEALPFLDGQFDRLLSVEVLYYTPDPAQVVAEWFRVLKPGGSLWVMVDYYKENRYSACWGDLLGLPTHYLGEAEYAELFTQAGFTAVRTQRLMDPRPVDQAGFTPGWGYETVDEVRDFRENVGSLMITGTKLLS